MYSETIPSHGQRAVDFLVRYIENPELIIPQWINREGIS